jgi:glycosyltransferase involved in cell wall biosynthesis
LKSILFVGNFLSKVKGSRSVSENILGSDLKDEFKFQLASSFQNQFLRIVNMIFSTFLFHGKVIHIDVFSGRAFWYASIVSRIALWRKFNILMTLHGGALPEYSIKNMTKVRNVLSRADYLQAPSKYLIDYFKSCEIEVNYLPNPVKLDDFPYNRSRVKPNSILWVRAFTSIYNPDIPIRVLKGLISDFPNSTLTMIGPDKGMRNEIYELAKDLDVIDSIKFIGPIPNNQLYKYYQSHQVYLNTTSFESFGVAVVEAASCGIPIVSNPVGEIPYLWTDEKDILFAQGNSVEHFVLQVQRIFVDPELELRLSKNGNYNALQFNWDRIKPLWRELLNKYV